MRATRVLTALAVLAAGASSAVACPVCESETGKQVRDGIFNNEFGGTFLAMVLPFLVIAAVVGPSTAGPREGGLRRGRLATSDHRKKKLHGYDRLEL